MSGTVASSLQASPKGHTQTCRIQPEMATVQSIKTYNAASFCSSSDRHQYHNCLFGLQLRCFKAGIRRRISDYQQKRVFQDGTGQVENSWGAKKAALRRSICSLGFASSLDILSAPSAIAAESPFLDGVDTIKHNLEVCFRTLPRKVLTPVYHLLGT